MSRTAKVRLFFGDADYDFALLVGQCIELQELTDAGLMDTLARIGGLWVRDLKAVLRLGLIGGGMKKEEAFRLVERHVVAGELAECAITATQVVNAAITGAEDEPLGEGAGERTSGLHFPDQSSAMPISSEPLPPLESAPPKSKARRSGKSAPQ